MYRVILNYGGGFDLVRTPSGQGLLFTRYQLYSYLRGKTYMIN